MNVLINQFHFISIFPDLIHQAMNCGVIGQAVKKQILGYQCINPRKFTADVHQSVDDKPYGGSDGMLMKPEPLQRALQSLGSNKGLVCALSPQGEVWNNQKAQSWSQKYKNISFVCGRYAGIDQRFIESNVDVEISLGDFILSGGELAALSLVDSISRFVPGVLGNLDSPIEDSFHNNQFEAPQFTRPFKFNDLSVPSVLLSGHHQKILEFRQKIGFLKTYLKRPDLLKDNFSLVQLKTSLKYLETLSEIEMRSIGVSREHVESLSQETFQNGK